MKMFSHLLFFSLIVFGFPKSYLVESEGKSEKAGDYVDNQAKIHITNGDAKVKPSQVGPGDKESQSGEKNKNRGGNQDVKKNFNRHFFNPGKSWVNRI